MIHRLALVGDPPEDRTFNGNPIRPQIAPTATLEAFVTVDAGTVRPTTIGPGSYLLKHSHVGHDARIGRDCDLATGCIVGGHAKLGDRVKVGLGAVILPYRKVGDDAHIGAGAVVTKDVPAGETWVGNPARKLEDHERDPRPHSERVAEAIARHRPRTGVRLVGSGYRGLRGL